MARDHDGHYEGGSPVDTTRANTSPEERNREDVPPAGDKADTKDRDKKS